MTKGKKNKKKQSKVNFILPSVFLAVIVSLAIPCIYNLEAVSAIEDEIYQVELNIAEISEEIDDLNKELEQTDDLEYIEKLVRERYGYIKPNEIVFIATQE